MRRLSLLLLIGSFVGFSTAPASSASAQDDRGRDRDRPRLGVELAGGVLVIDVDDGSVAAEAGIRAGDIIVGWDKSDITRIDDIIKAFATLEGGDAVAVRLQGESKPRTVVLNFPKPLPSPILGVSPQAGAWIVAVGERSIAEQAGLRPRDFIIRWNGKKLDHDDDLVRAVRGIKNGREYRLDLIRDREAESLALSFGSSRRATSPRPRRRGTLSRVLEQRDRIEEIRKLATSVTKLERRIDRIIVELEDDPTAAGARRAVRSLRSLRRDLGGLTGIVDRLEEMISGVSGILGELKDQALDIFGSEDFRDVTERFQELMGRGRTWDQVEGILRKEFPEIDIRIGGNRREREREHEENRREREHGGVDDREDDGDSDWEEFESDDDRDGKTRKTEAARESERKESNPSEKKPSEKGAKKKTKNKTNAKRIGDDETKRPAPVGGTRPDGND